MLLGRCSHQLCKIVNVVFYGNSRLSSSVKNVVGANLCVRHPDYATRVEMSRVFREKTLNFTAKGVDRSVVLFLIFRVPFLESGGKKMLSFLRPAIR